MSSIEKIKRDKIREIKEKQRETELVIEVNDKDFEEKVIGQSTRIPIVVDFWAPWCMPCLMLSPILEKFVKEYKGKFVLVKCNVDEARENATKYAVMSIPSVKMFKNREIVDEFIGAVPEPSVKEWLDKNLGR